MGLQDAKTKKTKQTNKQQNKIKKSQNTPEA